MVWEILRHMKFYLRQCSTKLTTIFPFTENVLKLPKRVILTHLMPATHWRVLNSGYHRNQKKKKILTSVRQLLANNWLCPDPHTMFLRRTQSAMIVLVRRCRLALNSVNNVLRYLKYLIVIENTNCIEIA